MYIGKSINIERRFKEHINGDGCPSSYIDNAIYKYGKDYFKFEIIEEFDKNTSFLNDVLNDSEQYYIAAYNTFQNDFHYNLTIGGDGTCGFTHSEKTKKKMSEAQSGENNPFYGKKHSEETKKKLSKANSGENNPNYGKHHSEEAKKKISKVRYGKHHLEETKKKISENHADVSGENNPAWKDYARIVKCGKTQQNKQLYAIRYQGKKIKHSISIDKLKKYFAENYPGEELRCEIE